MFTERSYIANRELSLSKAGAPFDTLREHLDGCYRNTN